MEEVIHGFMIKDDNILEAWADAAWVYRTYCDKRGSTKDNILDVVKNATETIIKISESNETDEYEEYNTDNFDDFDDFDENEVDEYKILLTRNPRLVTCSECKKEMSKQINKISKETFDIVIEKYRDDFSFLNEMNITRMKKDIHRGVHALFKASGGCSLEYLEKFDVELHKQRAEDMVNILKKITDDITERSAIILDKLKPLIDKYERYYTAIEEDIK